MAVTIPFGRIPDQAREQAGGFRPRGTAATFAIRPGSARIRPMADGLDDFYAQIPVFDGFARLTDPALYRLLPDNWVLGLSDVVASTAAIQAGQYKSVNVAGAALIAAVSNALGQRDFPFTFGGDGASFALPPEDAETARAALAATAAWVRDDLALALRVALVPVAAIRAAGWDVRIARYAPSPDVSYAMFMGGGLAWAGQELKAGAYAVEPATPGTRPDLSGLSCRWQEFPARHGLILSLIATPVVAESEAPFQELVGDILRMTGRESEARHPISDPKRAMGWPPPGLDVEARSSRGARESVLRRKAVLGLQTLASWASNRSTSTRPLSVIFRCGITGSGRKATCRNGSASTTPRLLARRAQRISALCTASKLSRLIRPATGSASSARPCRPRRPRSRPRSRSAD
jgi:hypothetical protein